MEREMIWFPDGVDIKQEFQPEIEMEENQPHCQLKEEAIVPEETAPISEDDNPLNVTIVKEEQFSESESEEAGRNTDPNSVLSNEGENENEQCSASTSKMEFYGGIKVEDFAIKLEEPADDAVETIIAEGNILKSLLTKTTAHPSHQSQCNSESSFSQSDGTEDNIGGQYVCNICSKSFKRSRHLRRHSNLHTRQQSYRCEFCIKCFSRRDHLKRHLNVHTGQRVYKCEICNKSFTRAERLKEHVIAHLGQRAYTCGLCKKSFSRQDRLREHVKSHTEKKAYFCEKCDMSFTTNSHLKEHLKTHTNEQPFVCETCSKRFSRASNLKRHRTMHARHLHVI